MAIVLLTDFGNNDAYVGTMKGVLHKITPDSVIIDLAHGIRNFSILPAALSLYQAYQFFPEGSIFVIVVDPGVGGDRIPLLAKTPHYTFIAPDNGVLSMVLEEAEEPKLFQLDQDAYHLHPVSKTFHGRDIFVPVAGHLAQGIEVLKLGTPIEKYHRTAECFPQTDGKKIIGRILNIDRFGNCITNIQQKFLSRHLSFENFYLEFSDLKKGKVQEVVSYYAEGRPNTPCLLFGSSDFLEISINLGSAAEELKINIGDTFNLLYD